jgi:glycosyltransferase involved in cell wall biosynthesis
MRHILMTADAVGGVWTYAVDLARELGRRHVAVTLAVMGPQPSAAQQEEIRALPLVTLRHAPFRLEWMQDPWHDVRRAGKWLLDLERDLSPDVLHLNGYCHASLPWRAPVLIAAHSCVLSWWSAVHGSDAPIEWNRYAANVTSGLFAADLVVAPTAAMLAALEFHYGPLRRAMVISNGRSGPESLTRSKQPFVFSSGRIWDPAKNIGRLAECAEEISWPIFIAGDTTSPDGSCVSLPQVTCLGRLDSHQMQAWMRRASVYALPARYEPFGLSILEAALAGCALVLGDIPTLHEVWGSAAMYVPVEDRGALIAALRRCIEDEDERQALATRAHTRALELTADRMAQAYCDAYQELVDSHRLTIQSLASQSPRAGTVKVRATGDWIAAR